MHDRKLGRFSYEVINVGNIRKAFRCFSESIQTLSKRFLDVSRFLYSRGCQVCSMDVTIAKEDILIFVLVSFPRREAMVFAQNSRVR